MKALRKLNVFTFLVVIASFAFALRLYNIATFRDLPASEIGMVMQASAIESPQEASSEEPPALTQEDVRKAINATAADVNASPETRAAAMKAGVEWITYHARVVADRRAKPPGDDLISTLVYAEIDGERLDDEALRQEALLILIGGDETTRHVLVGGLYELLRHPAQKAALVAAPGRIPTAVEEMLRWVTPIQNMNRTATRDLDFHGAKIRSGDKVLLLYPSANRDEAVFADPERFDTTREPNEHLAFGGYGPHFCLGASLARLELRVMFEELLAAFPDVELAGDHEPERRRSNFIVGYETLPIRWRPRR